MFFLDTDHFNNPFFCQLKFIKIPMEAKQNLKAPQNENSQKVEDNPQDNQDLSPPKQNMPASNSSGFTATASTSQPVKYIVYFNFTSIRTVASKVQ